MLYNVVLVSAIQQCGSVTILYIYTHIYIYTHTHTYIFNSF